jgi:hypothetical protein
LLNELAFTPQSTQICMIDRVIIALESWCII